VGGSAYWFEQITISSSSVPDGTIGVADFTLFFEGHVSAESQRSGRENKSSIGYRWACIPESDGGDNVADPNVGEYSESIVYGGLGYTQFGGQDFLDQPRHHQIRFRFGLPFDFTIAVHCQGEVYRDGPGKARVELRCKGWNGFRDVQVVGGVPVTNATITSQTGFNYANAGSTTYTQWASLYQLDAASMEGDANQNGLSNSMEHALGRNPLEPNPGNPIIRGTMKIGGQDFSSFTYTRPRLGARPSAVTYLPKRSTTLGTWSDTGLETTVAPSTSQTETVTVRSTQPMSAQTQEFMRLEVSSPPQ